MPTNGSTRGRIACLLAREFEDSEVKVPLDRLRAAGFQVEIIGTQAGEKLAGKRGKVEVITDLGIDDAEVESYAGLLIPGGHSPDYLRADQRFIELVKAFDATGRPLAAVCHGPQLLLTAGLVRGRTLTAWATVQVDLQQAGAAVRDEQVVVDDNWITSRKPDDLEAFSATFIDRLSKADAAATGRGTGATP